MPTNPTPEEIDARLGIKPYVRQRGHNVALGLKNQLPKIDSAASSLDAAIRRAEAAFLAKHDADQQAQDNRDLIRDLGRTTR